MQADHRPMGVHGARNGLLCLLAIGAAMLINLGIAQNIRVQREATDWVGHTRDVLLETFGLALHVQEAVSEGRAYRLDKNPEDVARLNAAAAAVQESIDSLRRLTRDNPQQQQALQSLVPLIEARLGVLRSNSGIGAPPGTRAYAPASAAEAAALMGRVRAGIANLQATENALLMQRRAALAGARNRAAVLLAIGGGLFSASLLLAVILTLIRRREKAHQAALLRLNASLDRQVTERTEDLRRLSEKLAESQVRQKLYLDHAPAAMVIMARRPDDQYFYEYMNLACEEAYGEPRAHFIGRTLYEVWPREIADKIDREFGACTEPGTPFPFLLERKVDGITRYRDGCLSPIGDSGVRGRPEKILVSTWDVTDRRTLEQRVAEQQAALRRNEEVLEETGRLANVGGWEYDLQTGKVFWSAQTCRICGEEPGYQPDLDEAINYYAPEARPVIRAALEKCAEDGTGFDLEVPFLRCGERIWVRAFGMAEMVAGKPVRLMGAFQNVTEQIEQRVALQDATDRIRLANETAGIGVWAWNVASDTIEWDEQTFRIFGLAPQPGPLAAKFWISRFLPGDFEQIWRSIKLCAAEGRNFDAEHPILWEDGSVRIIRSVAKIITNAQGGIERLLGVKWDITEARNLARQRHEQAALLAESEANARLVLDNSRDVISRVNAQGNRLYASAATQKIYGLSPEEFLARDFASFIHPDDKPGLAEAQAQMRAGKISEITMSFRILHAELGERWVETVACGLRDEAGKPAGYISSTRDVTERMSLEVEREERARELRLANLELERLARHMGKARRIAEQASRAKTRFLAGMSHELRTPLNGILGYAQLLRMDAQLTPSQGERVQAMLSAGNHLLEMISCVLDLSEIETDGVDLQIAPVDVLALANACMDIVRPAAEAKCLGLRLSVGADVPRTTMGSMTRLRQVLLNLLGNAVKYTPHGSVDLRLCVRFTQSGSRRLLLEVADTGPGIPPEKRHLLFKEFERLGAEHKKGVEGAGLGLSLAKRLAALMGGELLYADNPGGGSIFSLDLPLLEGPAPAAEKLPAEPPAVAAHAPASEAHILVVDDVAMNRDIATAFIRSAGYEVSCASGGQQAVELAATQDFQAILMDVRMPGMDGLEATRRIRALGGPRAAVPILALTAQVFTEQIALCREAGMDGHVVKPFTMESLLQALAKTAQAGHAAAIVAPPAMDHRAEASTAPPSAPLFGADIPAFNADIFGHAAAALSPDAVDRHLEKLAERIEALRSLIGAGFSAARGSEVLCDDVHALGGSAGMFGFDRLAFVCKHFEHAVGQDPSQASCLAGCLDAALLATLAAISSRQALQPAAHPLLGRMSNATMRDIFTNWQRASDEGKRLPKLAALELFEDALREHGFVLGVSVGATPLDMQVERIGTALTQRLGRDLTGSTLIPADEEILGAPYSSHRNCLKSGPKFDYTVVSLGTFGKLRFERLLLPLSESGDCADHVLGFAIFEDVQAIANAERADAAS